MAYESGKTYFFIPTLATRDAEYNRAILNKEVQPLSLNTQGVGNHYNNRNVNVWSLDWSTDMQWQVVVYNGFARVLCAGDTSYGLDYYWGQNNAGNCDIYKVAGNEEDSKINFITVNAQNNLYKIQSYRNDTGNNRYLTVIPGSDGSFANGCDVRWQPLDESKATQQTWWLVPVEDVTGSTPGTGTGPDSKVLPFTETVNQNYIGYNSTVRSVGCALCSGLMISKFYGTSVNNTVDYFYNNYWFVNGYSWGTPNANISATITYSLATIKSEIDAGRPVAIHAYVTYANGNNSEHWVVAYGYTNNASSGSDIMVADPYNPDELSQNGRFLTLSAAYSRFSTYNFDRLRTSSSK